MAGRQEKLNGTWLVFASGLFWLSWLFMPGVGVTDTSVIFALVGQHRSDVFVSIVLQLVSAAAYAPGAMCLHSSALARESPVARGGAVLLVIGAMGSAADAIFHLVAFEMTAPSVAAETMAPVMRQLQGPDLRLLLPFVLAFFVGHALVLWAWRKRDRIARSGLWLFASLPFVAVLGVIARRSEVVPGRAVGLTVLGVLSGSLVLLGVSLLRRDAKPIAWKPIA